MIEKVWDQECFHCWTYGGDTNMVHLSSNRKLGSIVICKDCLAEAAVRHAPLEVAAYVFVSRGLAE